jgi:hypothetical protein
MKAILMISRLADRKMPDVKLVPHFVNLHLLVLLVLLVLLLSCPPLRAAVPDPGDPLNGTWRVCLDGFFEPAARKNATTRRALPIYVISRDGKLLHGLGSAPDWNQTTYPADVGGLRYDAASGKLTGTMQVKLNPDPWIPRDHKPIACVVEIEAALDRANPTNKTALQGTYRAKFGTEPVQGSVSGYVYTQPLVDLARCQLTLTLNHALLGGREPYHNRIAVRLDIANGQTVAGQFGLVGLNNQPYDFRPFEKFNVASTRDGFSGELIIPHDVLVWGMGERVRLASLPIAQTSYYRAEKDGSGVVSGGGFSLAVDFSGKCGAPVLVAVASEKDLGKHGDKHGAIARVSEMKAGPANFRVLTLGRDTVPTIKAHDGKVSVGGRTLSFDGTKVVME